MHHDKVALALDRSSARTYDQDGHLHVTQTPISKANVCPYYGREIPDHETLGLAPERVYQLLRHPDELMRGAATFDGKPLLNIHRPVTADDHEHEVVAGAVKNVVFAAPYLRADLSIWDGDSIRDVESNRQRELSCGYRYRADMTPGTYEGAHYDGVMRDITGNHVALVSEGRAGPDVLVGDSALPNLKDILMTVTSAIPSRTAAMAHGALMVHLRPKLAADAKIDLGPALKGVTGKNFKAKKPAIKTAIDAACKGKLAKDADLDDVVKLLDTLEEMTPEEVEEAAEDADPDETDEEKKVRLAKEAKDKAAKDKKGATDTDPDDKDDKKAMDEALKGMVTRAAMDEAIRAATSAATKTATDAAMKTQRDLREAERFVRPWVGDIVAQDSAEGVFRTALATLGVKDADTLHPDALRPVLEAQPVPGAKPPRSAPLGQDAAAVEGFAKRYPEASRIRVL